MTLEQRLDHVEQQNERILQQNQRIERKNKRLTAALTLMAVAMCAVVTVAATSEKDGVFDEVVARSIYVANDEGRYVVALESSIDGSGFVETMSAKNGTKKRLVQLTSTVDGYGSVRTYQDNVRELVRLGATDSGGFISVYNKTGEEIATLIADEYGNGVVGAWNRKGKGRTLKPGP